MGDIVADLKVTIQPKEPLETTVRGVMETILSGGRATATKERLLMIDWKWRSRVSECRVS